MPGFSLKGPDNTLLLEVKDMGPQPVSGRLLRGLTPLLLEMEVEHVFLSTFRKRREPWSAEPKKIITYQELVHWDRGARPGGVYRGVSLRGGGISRDDIVAAFERDPFGMLEWAARLIEGTIVTNTAPWPLEQVFTPKPWGREGWYTGIEARGISRVTGPTGGTPLPYALGMFPVPIVGESEAPPILLKTLEPLPDAVYGDLYLEVHREKWETYVVMEVDREAWPKGVGKLRAGLAPKRIEEYRERHGEDWQAPLAADLEGAIGEYEEVRRAQDAMLDEALRARGHDLAQPAPPALLRELTDALPKPDREREARLRKNVEKFLGVIDLRPGDVVSLPPGVLHSLQHGVKVLEFQTPTYERLIAMFAQKVLTQPHWDTREAIAQMEKAPYVPPKAELLEEGEGFRLERIVRYPQFEAQRLRVEPGQSWRGKTAGHGQYVLLVGLTGSGALQVEDGASFPVEPGAACLLPATMGDYTLSAGADGPLTLVMATPPSQPQSGEQAPAPDWEASDALG